MNALHKGLALAGAQLLLVLSMAGKYYLDRETRPREWIQTRPVDPNLPIRGRYVSLGLEGRAERLAYFIPEHVPDPSARPAGEELWVECTIPRKGPPRPIRLGVRQKSGGEIRPLQLN